MEYILILDLPFNNFKIIIHYLFRNTKGLIQDSYATSKIIG